MITIFAGLGCLYLIILLSSCWGKWRSVLMVALLGAVTGVWVVWSVVTLGMYIKEIL